MSLYSIWTVPVHTLSPWWRIIISRIASVACLSISPSTHVDFAENNLLVNRFQHYLFHNKQGLLPDATRYPPLCNQLQYQWMGISCTMSAFIDLLKANIIQPCQPHMITSGLLTYSLYSTKGTATAVWAEQQHNKHTQIHKNSLFALVYNSRVLNFCVCSITLQDGRNQQAKGPGSRQSI